MKTNVGMTDKIIRLVIGLVLIIIALIIPMSAALQIILLIIGIIALLTALTGFCCLYTLIGVNTCKTKMPPPEQPGQ